MSEYEYVKGKGWVVSVTREHITYTDARGTFIIYNRPPKEDELRLNIGIGSQVDREYKGFEGHMKWLTSNEAINISVLFSNISREYGYYSYAVKQIT